MTNKTPLPAKIVMDEEIDPAIVRAADAARLGVAAFFVTLLLTLAYGSVVGLALAFPWGGIFGFVAAAVPAPVAAGIAGLVYGLLGWLLTKCNISRTQARRLCFGLGALLGPALTLGAVHFIFGGISSAIAGIFGRLALASGGLGGALIWSSVSRVLGTPPRSARAA